MADVSTGDRHAKLIAMGAQLDATWTHQNSFNASPQKKPGAQFPGLEISLWRR